MNTASETVFWWVRHAPVNHGGLVYGGSSDWPAEIDEDDALWPRLAACLPTQAHWYTSGLLRAQQTADALLRHHPDAGAVRVEPDFSEQSFGRWEGMSYQELEAHHAQAWRAFWQQPQTYRPPEGESFADQRARVERASTRLISRHAGKNVVIVCHGGTVRAAISIALGLSLDRGHAIRIDNNSLSCTVYHAFCPYDEWRRVLGAPSESSSGDGAWELRFCNTSQQPR